MEESIKYQSKSGQNVYGFFQGLNEISYSNILFHHQNTQITQDSDQSCSKTSSQQYIEPPHTLESIQPSRAPRSLGPRIAKKCKCCHLRVKKHSCEHNKCQGFICIRRIRQVVQKITRQQRKQRNLLSKKYCKLMK